MKEEAEKKAKEEAEKKAEEKAENKAKEDAKKKAKEEADNKAKEEAEKKAQEEAEKKAKKETEEKAKEEAETKAKEECEKKMKEEAEKKAKEEAEKKAKEKAEKKAKEDAEKKAKKEAEKKAKEEAEKKVKEEDEKKVKEEAEKKVKEEAEKKAKEEAEKKAIEKAEKKAKEDAEKKTKEEVEKKAKEEAEKKAKEEAEKKAKEEAEKKAKEKAEKKAKEDSEKIAKEEAEKKVKEEADKKAKEEAEKKTKEEAEKKAQEEAEKKAKEEAEKKAEKEAEKKAKEEAEKKEKEEAEKKAKEEAEKKAKEKTERKAKKDAEKKAKVVVEKKVKEESEKKAKEEAENKAKEAEKKAEAEAEKKAKDEAENKAKEETEKQAKDEAEKKAKEKTENKVKEEVKKETKEQIEKKLKQKTEQATEEADKKKGKHEAENKAKGEAEKQSKEEANTKFRETKKVAKEEGEKKVEIQKEKIHTEFNNHNNAQSNGECSTYKSQSSIQYKNEVCNGEDKLGFEIKRNKQFEGRTFYDDNLEMFKPQSYHGPRFADRKPIFSTSLTDRSATVDSRVKLTCSIINAENVTTMWLKNGKTLTQTDKYDISFSNGLASLEILNTTIEDSGEYSCIAKNEHGVSTTFANLKILEAIDTTVSPPTFTRPLKDSYKISEDELILECRIRYSHSHNIKWYKDSFELQSGGRYRQSYSADGICKLSIKNPEKSDTGRYTCRAENELWSDQVSHEINFTSKEDYVAEKYKTKSILKGPRDQHKPYFAGVLTDHLVPSGGIMALQVEIKGPAEITWFKESHKLPKASSRHRTFEERGVHTLLIPNVTEFEAGKYTCRASNIFGRSETSSYVQIIHPSSIRDGKPAMFLSRPDTVMTVTPESDIVVSFRVTGDPKPSIVWMKGLHDITTTHRTYRETSDDYNRLTLKRATEDDVGTYCILARNRFGTDRAFFTVRLRHRARSVTPTKETTQSILTDIPSFQERKYFTDVPGPITGEPVVVDTGRNWISLSWGKPEHRGAAPVIAYKIEAWLRGGEEARWTDLGVSPLNSFDAFNLKPDGEYQFRITPRNRYGWGESVQSGSIVIGRTVNLPEFIRILPGQLKVLLGSDVSLECEVREDPSLVIRWFRDASEVFPEDDERYQIGYKNGICTLSISRINENDEGRFMCEATNKAGRVSTFARVFTVSDPKILSADKNLKLRINDYDKVTSLPPQFTMRLRDRRVQVSYPVRLTCQIAGCPEPRIKWYKDDVEIKQDARFQFSSEDHFHTLEIAKTVLEDSGIYCAVARNNHGSVSCRCNLVVDKGIRAYISPQFQNQLEPSTSEIKEGKELRLTGKVQAYPAVGVNWYKNGVRLRPSRKSIMTLSYDGRVALTVTSINKRDAGVYTCVAANEVGQAESSATVEVVEVTADVDADAAVAKIPPLGKDVPYSKEPKFLKKPRSSEAYEGDNIVILCEVIGDPKPEVVWLRDFLKPDYYKDASHFLRIGDGPEYRLEIPNAKLDFTGTYTVYAKNCYGDAKAIISLQIKVKDNSELSKMENGKKISNIQTIPSIVQELKDLRCCDGDSVALECKLGGNPPFDVRWEKEGKLIHLGEDFNAEFDGETATLSIKQVYPEDEGEYTCVAYNDLGKVFTSACLLVDLPEEKENLLKQQLRQPSNLTVNSTTARASRSVSPLPRSLAYPPVTSRGYRIRAAPPKFYAIPHNRVAEEGETVRFQCAVAGHPDPWVTWSKDGSPLSSSSRITITEVDDLRILEIREITPHDSGMYKVVLENDVGRIEASARLEVISHRFASARGLRARSLSPKPHDSYGRGFGGSSVRYGSTARLFYDIRSVPTPFLKWYKDGVPIADSAKFEVYHDKGVACLVVKEATFGDQGSYKCVATNGENSVESIVELKIMKEELAPRITNPLLKSLNVTEGNPVTLRLEVTGRQPFDVVWMKDGCVLPDCAQFRQSCEDEFVVLAVNDAKSQDSGCYTCEVYNLFGEASAKCQLVVHEKCGKSFDFVKFPSPVITTSGKTVSFCVKVKNADADKPKISWEVAGVPVTVGSRFQVEEDGDVDILHITGVTHLDVGEVKCTATKQSKSATSAEAITCSTQLTVVPDLDSFVVLEGSSASAASMEALNGVSSGVKSDVMVVSKIDEPAMLLRKPQDTTALVGDRVLLKATYMGHPEPTVRWTKAGKELKNDERTSITSGDGVSCLLLQNITTDDSGKYDVSVENRFGADSNYASVSVEGPPDPPSGKPCVSAIMDSITVAWSSSPYDGGKIVTGFAVEYSLAGSDVWSTATENCYSLRYTIKGLQLGARYLFRVRAQNVHGYSKPSQESDPLLLEEKTDSGFEPRIVTLEPGPEFKSRFEVLEELGKGRFGVVHKVMDKTSLQKLAAKFIKCRTSKDRDKVQEEIDIMNLLRHQKLLQLAAAFDNPKEMIMVTEYISGGELFERVVADDFTLTEKDCILFMRQICEGVAYMHSQNIVHLDLKPENIMCHTRTSHEIKIIDFGLAQKLNPDKPIRVLFGTPEFIPPEIINYEPIGVESDMWSLGVICYVLLSGLSPFMGDNDAETFANITRADYDFEDEAFNTVSQNARDFIAALLLKRREDRLSAEQCLKHIWLDPESHKNTVVLSTDKLKKFIIRRKWQKTGNAIRALGRMATLSASRRNSANSTPSTPRPSITGLKMSSLNEENTNGVSPFENEIKSLPEEVLCNNNVDSFKENGFEEMENKKVIRTRAHSERSDSGVSDCSSHLTSSSCTSTPLLGKKFPINEEPEPQRKISDNETSPKFVSNTSIILSPACRIKPIEKIDEIKRPDVLKLESKIDTLTKKVTSKSKSPSSTGSLKRLPIYSSRSVAKTIKKFDKIDTLPKPVDSSNNKLEQAKPSKTEKNDAINLLEVNNKLNKTASSPVQHKKLLSISKTPKAIDDRNDKISSKSTVEKIVQKISSPNETNNLKPPSVKYKCPSPSLLRKTQAVLAKEQSNEYYMSKHNNSNQLNDQISKTCPKSPAVNRKDKPKSASFQKAAAFWNSPKS